MMAAGWSRRATAVAAAASVFATLLARPLLAAPAGDQVTSLPGWSGPLLSPMWSGYIDLPGGKHLHYIFIESMNAPATDPVLLWLNGGPGCSSLEGLFDELGPYHIVPGTTTLYANPYTWNNFSSILYLESPAGVGYSYCDTAACLQSNDTTTAADNLAAVQWFFDQWPQYRANDFYITGESYAGIYVPMLALAVWEANQGSPNPIALKGIMVGNGCIGTEAGVCSRTLLASFRTRLQDWRGHGLVPLNLYMAAEAACGDWVTNTTACWRAFTTAAAATSAHIDIYDMYGPCHYNYTAVATSNEELEAAAASIDAGAVLTTPLAHAWRVPPPLGAWGPVNCLDAGDITAYLNQPAVVAALHAVSPLTWIVCTANISYTKTMTDERAVVYPTLLEAAHLRVLIFNGEADACVPWADNEAWTLSMNYTIAAPWRAWMWDPDNVGGYITQFTVDGGANATFAFTTVRGAGHMVPQYQPQAAWSMANRFINNLPWY